MKKYALTTLLCMGLVAVTGPVCAEQDRVPNLDFNGEIAVGAVIGEDLLGQAFAGADQLARDVFSSVEGTVLLRINGKLVRVTKGGRNVVEIFDDPGTMTNEAWKQDRGKRPRGWKKAKKKERKRRKREQEKRKRQGVQ